jgi:hypothetical protein
LQENYEPKETFLVKSHMLRSYLLLSWGLLLILGLLSWGVKEPDLAVAYSPRDARLADPIDTWDVNEIFICGDGSEQFIELRNPTSADQGTEFGEEDLIATNYFTSAQGVGATGSNVVTVGDVANRKIYLPIIRKDLQ